MIRADTAIRVAAGVTVVGLAGIAGAISYSHMVQLAHAHGESGWRGHMFPLSVDGIEIVASLVLLADRRAGRRSGFLPWAALIAGTGASLAANVAVGGSDWIGRAVSGWPAFALLIAIKLLFGLLDHPTDRAADGTPAGTVPAQIGDRPDQPGTVPAVTDHASPGRDGPDTVVDDADDATDCADGADTAGPKTGGGHRPAPVLSTALDVSALLPAARAAWATLADNGKPLTREALAKQMRADGHAASNARVSALLRLLGAEQNEPRGGHERESAA
jgi:hypothetical protein